MRDLVILSASSHKQLAQEIANRLGIELGNVSLGKFSNKETSVQVMESVRDMHVFILQTSHHSPATGLSANDYMMELFILIAACKMASARKITVIVPSFPYARQPDAPYTPKRRLPNQSPESVVSLPSSSKSSPLKQVSHAKQASVGSNTTTNGYKTWVARSGTLVANMLVAAGTNHIITMDLHDPQFQGFFDIPVDNLYGAPLMIKYIRDNVADYKQAVIVSPDAGGAKRASSIARKLGCDFALIHKDRKFHNHRSTEDLGMPAMTPGDVAFNMTLVGKVDGKKCILIDDIADTSHTITRAASLLHVNGATKVIAVITHGILSADAPQRIIASHIDELVVSNTVPQDEHKAVLGDRLKVYDTAGLFSEAIRRIYNGESLSGLFS
jgi:ribose-phosphate pyrophosphokinase